MPGTDRGLPSRAEVCRSYGAERWRHASVFEGALGVTVGIHDAPLLLPAKTLDLDPHDVACIQPGETSRQGHSLRGTQKG